MKFHCKKKKIVFSINKYSCYNIMNIKDIGWIYLFFMYRKTSFRQTPLFRYTEISKIQLFFYESYIQYDIIHNRVREYYIDVGTTKNSR